MYQRQGLADQRALAIVDNGDVPCVYAAAKGNNVPVLPHFGRNDVTGIDRRGKAHVESADEREIVVTNCLQYCVTGDAISTSAVQNRCIESRLACIGRIDMQRIVIA